VRVDIGAEPPPIQRGDHYAMSFPRYRFFLLSFRNGVILGRIQLFGRFPSPSCRSRALGARRRASRKREIA
jgi:hypothetical protein